MSKLIYPVYKKKIDKVCYCQRKRVEDSISCNTIEIQYQYSNVHIWRKTKKVKRQNCRPSIRNNGEKLKQK